MAPSTQNVMDGIVTRLNTISGLHAYGFVPLQISPPEAFVDFDGDINYHGTFKNGLLEMAVRVTLVISMSSDRVNEKVLGDYASATGALSIAAAIEGDSTLGGAVHDCTVIGFRRAQAMPFNGADYYGGVFTLAVLAAGF